MRLVVALFVVLVAFGQTSADDEFDIAGRDSLEMRGDAMVWEDAQFFFEPWEGGAAIRFSSFGRGRRDEVGRAVPVRIVSSAMRDFIEIEFVQAETCTWRRIATDVRITGVRMFVKRDDLAPVLVKPFSIAYRDGTSVRLQPGVPVHPTSDDRYVVAARADVLSLPIPHASVGYSYPRSKVEEPALPQGQLWRLERMMNVKLGDDTFEARTGWLATVPAKHGDTANVRWTTRCIDLVVGVPTKSLRKGDRPVGEGYVELGNTRAKASHTIPGGTPLSTFGGREVAIAADVIDVPPPSGDKVCFDAKLTLVRLEDRPWGQIARTTRLCAPASFAEGAPVATAAPSNDPLAAPPDVAQPPSDAKRTPKGVSWKRLKTGKGTRKPTEDSTVVVHYTGWTTDGNMFDSSVKRGQPARFALRSLIAGWTDGLQVMAVGDKVRLWIPEELAYKGSPGAPQGMLVFDVELLGID